MKKEKIDVATLVFGGYLAKNTKNGPNWGELFGLFTPRSSHRDRHWSSCILKGRRFKMSKSPTFLVAVAPSNRNVGLKCKLVPANS